ncbi:MAG: enoyl-CoA hydratase/isomerase family protein [Acidimicrobiales bacterium]
MSDEPVLLIEDDGGARVLTLNRPAQLNAFDQALWHATAEALEAAAADDAVRCVLITGAGRAFSAGQDLGEMADPRSSRTRSPATSGSCP